MKNLVIPFLLVFVCVQAAFGQTPDQNGKGKGKGYCACMSLFCSAMQQCNEGQTCTCTCTAFTCTCTPCGAHQMPVAPTVSPEQAANRQEFTALLRSFGDTQANRAADLLDGAYLALSAGNISVYQTQAVEAENAVKSLPVTQKSILNNWIAGKNYDYQF